MQHDLRARTIRLAAARPDLRPHLLAALRRADLMSEHGFNVRSRTVSIAFGSQRRRVVVVEVEHPHTSKAFYESTGTGGFSDAGDWVPFYGLADLMRPGSVDVPWLNHVWFVKGETKTPHPDSEDGRIQRALHEADVRGDLQPGQSFDAPSSSHPEFATLGAIRDTYESCADLNRFLAHHGALKEAARWAGSNPMIGVLVSGAESKFWSDMRSFIEPLVEKAGLSAGRAMSMRMPEIEKAAGVGHREAYMAWRAGR